MKWNYVIFSENGLINLVVPTIYLDIAFRDRTLTEWQLTNFSSRFRDVPKAYPCQPYMVVETFIFVYLTEEDVPRC